ncbi:heat shock protein HslJ [Cronobacter dublinensis subsp. dublinensis]|uniref:heat shock protein HslJ n=1 Tax=Cronobacter dublinensis TaxID=413497 RepID=UPI001DC5F283|nr:heat shock protein HslJ [Cronobacter dublinensis subsp. dublinensis]EGT5667287.1 heat shock protein HslJ [Cronobacter dublinensis subsp. dublinensis]EGT5675183.1 heat shock protein HslJ [Cronobacter dublinensis subsp. dublinensis]EGT5679371.1 heat shock protein HslJ [Cronobacter dublinensis subsp. dublinensis]EGT5685765.1 heat shock protein HslJ [Cronobacter dublinensis subsp. dublinensis]
MKKILIPLLAGMALAGCQSTSSSSHITPETLQHHRYVLQTVNGAPLDATRRVPELSFGEKMHVSGSMCNRFMGQGELHGDTLKVNGLASTRMLCAEPQLNELDKLIGEMLSQGAMVSVEKQQLTLHYRQYTLVYKLADLM